MNEQRPEVPDNTAVRVALWRAMHVQVDESPHVLEDEIGMRLAVQDDSWRSRPDMDPNSTKTFRASVVIRARFIEDLVVEQTKHGVDQYVILGAGLDTFAQRRPEIASRLKIFEVDQPDTQAWKKQRLIDLGFGIPKWQHFVPVNFEHGWYPQLVAAGFDATRPAILASTGVTMYITKDATAEILQQSAKLSSGSKLVMTYIVPFEFTEPEERAGREVAEKGARANGTPFISFFTSQEMKDMAIKAGFKEAECVSEADLNERYVFGRKDGLRTGKTEEILVATT